MNDECIHCNGEMMEEECDARYDDEDNAECNCSKGHIESLLKAQNNG